MECSLSYSEFDHLLPRTAIQKKFWQKKFERLKMKSDTDPSVSFDEVDEVVDVLAVGFIP